LIVRGIDCQRTGNQRQIQHKFQERLHCALP
jgi:hypothetical protein